MSYSFASIYKDIANDPAFDELRKSSSQVVPGDGDHLTPKLILVGEAPGKNEDERGIPFVGAAGKVLDELLDSIGLNRRRVYVTNVIKYRPEKNRTPTHKEVSASRHYLRRELKTVGLSTHPPVVLLGTTAHSLVFPDRNFSSDKGTMRRLNERWQYFTANHPASCLYDPSMKQVLLDQFSQLGDHMKVLQQ